MAWSDYTKQNNYINGAKLGTSSGQLNLNTEFTNTYTGLNAAGALADTAKTTADTALTLAQVWSVFVDVMRAASSHVDWNTITSSLSTAYGQVRTSTGVVNAEVSYKVALAAGTWSVNVLYSKASTNGIVTVYLDDVSLGTFDSYQASSTSYNNVATLSATVSASGLKTLKLKVESKNASASSYQGAVNGITLVRTA